MKDFDYQKARQFLARREQERQKRLDQRFQQAWADFRRMVDHIIANFRPRRIYQWGSLLQRDNFNERSDIDIGLEGIDSAEMFFRLYGEISEMTDFSVDLVQMEKIMPEFVEIIKMKGKVVYERPEENHTS